MKELNSMFVETIAAGAGVTFVKNISTMTNKDAINSTDNNDFVEISREEYSALACKFAETIGGAEFFSGHVCCNLGIFDSTLTATLLIYRRPEQLPEGTVSVIYDIVPVWWEFTLSDPDGNEIANDFCFKDFKDSFLMLA